MSDSMNRAGLKEEITDMISDEAYDDPKFKAGIALKFERATIRVTRVDRKNKRVWGQHIVLVDQKIIDTHEGHDVVVKSPTDFPWCNDCKSGINEPSNEDGEKKFLDRRDRFDAQKQEA